MLSGPSLINGSEEEAKRYISIHKMWTQSFIPRRLPRSVLNFLFLCPSPCNVYVLLSKYVSESRKPLPLLLRNLVLLVIYKTLLLMGIQFVDCSLCRTAKVEPNLKLPTYNSAPTWLSVTTLCWLKSRYSTSWRGAIVVGNCGEDDRTVSKLEAFSVCSLFWCSSRLDVSHLSLSTATHSIRNFVKLVGGNWLPEWNFLQTRHEFRRDEEEERGWKVVRRRNERKLAQLKQFQMETCGMVDEIRVQKKKSSAWESVPRELHCYQQYFGYLDVLQIQRQKGS